ncbi:MAG: adenylyltransferase/cytidyltransferase family protein, partial [Dongiaceae bacterium]
MDRPTTGFLLGKFLPPHRGHQYLIEFARAYVDQLTVLVCSIAREPIPGALRYRWMCESFPGVTLIHHTDEIPQAPKEHPQFWAIWRASIRRHVPGRIDCVFASEDYGARLAEELGSRFVPVDIERRNVPVSGRAVRDDPMTHWEALLPAVRPYYLKRVCVFDDDRSSLADALAAEFRTVCVHRY